VSAASILNRLHRDKRVELAPAPPPFDRHRAPAGARQLRGTSVTSIPARSTASTTTPASRCAQARVDNAPPRTRFRGTGRFPRRDAVAGAHGRNAGEIVARARAGGPLRDVRSGERVLLVMKGGRVSPADATTGARALNLRGTLRTPLCL
jgi:hypothetical protein